MKLGEIHQHDWIDISGPKDREVGQRQLICGICLEECTDTTPASRWEELELRDVRTRIQDPVSAAWGSAEEGPEALLVHPSLQDSLVPFAEVCFNLDWDLPPDVFDQIRQFQLEASAARSGTRGNPFGEGLMARGASRS